MEPDTAGFGRALRNARERAGLTQRALAERAGVALRTVRNIEAGHTAHPQPGSLRRLADAAGMAPGEHRLRVGVLGPLTVTAAGEAVEPGPPKQRGLLALLALQPGRVVPREEIIDVLWGEDPPASCVNLVHTYVAGLRRAIGAEALGMPVGGGYRLTADVDLARFEDLAAQARTEPPARVAELLAAALDEWRGPVVADLPDTIRRHPAATAVALRRVAIALDYAEAALATGRFSDIAGRLSALTHQEPLHEGLHTALMRALAAAGQQVAALRVFGELRTRLRDELGVEPGPAIRAAHEAILRGELPTPTAVPAQLPADVAGFVGRAVQLARLGEVVGTAAILAVTGTAGVGKTALAVHWAHRARERFPDGQLFADLRGHGPGSPVPAAAVLARFLRALGVPPERVPADAEEAAALYRTHVADRRVLVVLDNVATAEQVRPLLPGTPGALVLVTGRGRLGGLDVAAGGVHRVPLDVLDPDAAAALVTALAGSDEPADVAELARACAYLPLALRVAGAHLAARPGVRGYLDELAEHGRLARLGLDDDPAPAVRTTFDLAHDRLDADARRLFRLLSLVPGPDLTPDVAAALADVPVVRARSLLARLAAAGLVHEPVPGRHQCHDLLREYAQEHAAAQPDPAASDRLYGYLLRAAAAAAGVLHPHVLRVPVASGGPVPVSPAAALDWLDAEHANLLAAIAHGPDPYAWRIADALRGYLGTRGHGVEGLAAAQAGLAAARREQDVAGETAMANLLGVLHRDDRSAARAAHEEALALSRKSGDRAAEAVALHGIGRVAEPASAASRFRQALDIEVSLGNEAGQAICLADLGAAVLSLGELNAAVEYGTRALELSRAVREPETRAWHGLGLAHRAAGRLGEAHRCFEECRAAARAVGDSRIEVAAVLGLADTDCASGRLDDAVAHARFVLRAGHHGDRRQEAVALTVLAEVDLRRGRVRDALEQYRVAYDLGADEHPATVGLASAYRTLGDHDQAALLLRRVLDAVAESGAVLAEPVALTELAAVHLAREDLDAALETAESAVSGAMSRGQRLDEVRALRVRGRIRLCHGDPDAEADFATADAVLADLGLDTTTAQPLPV